MGVLLECHTIIQTGGMDGEWMSGFDPGELALVSVFSRGDHGQVISFLHASVSPIIKKKCELDDLLSGFNDLHYP